MLIAKGVGYVLAGTIFIIWILMMMITAGSAVLDREMGTYGIGNKRERPYLEFTSTLVIPSVGRCPNSSPRHPAENAVRNHITSIPWYTHQKTGHFHNCFVIMIGAFQTGSLVSMTLTMKETDCIWNLRAR